MVFDQQMRCQGLVLPHGRMAWGGHELPKVSLGPAMPDPSTPCRRATPEAALWPFQGCSARSACSLRPSCALLDPPRPAPVVLPVFHFPFLICLKPFPAAAKEDRKCQIRYKITKQEILIYGQLIIWGHPVG
jgi:hypothetical protein